MPITKRCLCIWAAVSWESAESIGKQSLPIPMGSRLLALVACIA